MLGRRSLPVLLLACCTLVYLLPPARAECITGTYEQCQEADFVPGYDLAGVGFDITTLRRTAGRITPLDNALLSNAKTCTLCPNRLLNSQMQKLPHGMAKWRSFATCAIQVSNELYKSAHDYTEWLSSTVGSDWRAGLEGDPTPPADPNNVVVSAGSRATLAQFAMKKDSDGGHIFVTREVACVYYRYQVTECPNPETYFFDWLKLLPPVYNNISRPLYFSLIGKYGTHYIQQVELGGRVREVTALRTCDLAQEGLSGDDVKDCLGMEAFSGISYDLAEKADHCRQLRTKKLSNQTFSEWFGDKAMETVGGSPGAAPTFGISEQGLTYQKWAGSLHRVPEVVSYTLAPLHDLVSFGGPTKKNLNTAIKDYIAERAVRMCCPACPEGALPQKAGGCNCQCRASLELTEDCCLRKQGLAAISVFVERGSDLYGDTVSQTDGYVQVTFEKELRKTTVINDDDNPQWGENLDFGVLRLSPGKQLLVEVWDEDGLLFGNDLLGSCAVEAISTLRSEPHTCTLTAGSVDFKVTVECLPDLSGKHCEMYQPSA